MTRSPESDIAPPLQFLIQDEHVDGRIQTWPWDVLLRLVGSLRITRHGEVFLSEGREFPIVELGVDLARWISDPRQPFSFDPIDYEVTGILTIRLAGHDAALGGKAMTREIKSTRAEILDAVSAYVELIRSQVGARGFDFGELVVATGGDRGQ